MLLFVVVCCCLLLFVDVWCYVLLMNAVLGSLLNKPNGYLNSRLRHVMRSVYEARSKTQDAIRDTRFVVCALTNTNRVFASQLMLYQVF